jgi:NAD(P)H-hydrate repair Nnr-like enzyme with NAD(P)H-hydrate epimerase domain
VGLSCPRDRERHLLVDGLLGFGAAAQLRTPFKSYRDGANISANQFNLASGYGTQQICASFTFTTTDDTRRQPPMG